LGGVASVATGEFAIDVLFFFFGGEFGESFVDHRRGSFVSVGGAAVSGVASSISQFL
jgi:hypothetical protein